MSETIKERIDDKVKKLKELFEFKKNEKIINESCQDIHSLITLAINRLEPEHLNTTSEKIYAFGRLLRKNSDIYE